MALSIASSSDGPGDVERRRADARRRRRSEKTPRLEFGSRLVKLVILCALAATAGCASLRRNPVGENVVSARQLTHQGVSAMQRGRWAEAEDLFVRAMEQYPLDQRARRHYSETLWRRGARGEAIAHMQEAVAMSGGDPGQLVRLGEMQLEVGDVASAARQATGALEVSPRLVSGWVLRGDAHRQSDQWELALACYHRALSYEPQSVQAQLAAAEVYRNLHRPERALSTLDALARQFAPGQTPQEILVALGLTQKQLDRHSDAAATLSAALASGPPSVDLLYQLSDAQWRSGDPANARITLIQALQIAPHHPGSRQLIARIDDQQRMAALNLR